ncbi:MAG: hypothetical protein HY951_07010 [Bacteroidia bacterium]|nr:hypothetical protein [Bacteroidia bacterium]
MLSFKIEQRVNEFCYKGNLEEYRDILKDLFQKIYDSGCQISTRDDSVVSQHETINEKCLIRISLHPINNIPIQTLWTIFHEFGHHLSGAINKKDENDWNIRYASEERAWEQAKIEVLKYPTLSKQINDFDKYKTKCLEDYLNKKKNMN